MVNFVLEYFNNEFTIDQCGQLFLGDSALLGDVSATAIYEVSGTVFRNVFRYWTDSSDVDTSNNDTDVRYYVKMEHWPANYIINPAHARMQVNGANTYGHDSSGEIATGFEPGRALVKHDFLRYISQKLFNTHLGVDLFTNESQMTYNIAKQGDLSGWGDISAVLWETSKSANGFLTNSDDASNNITRELLLQLINNENGVKRLKSHDISNVADESGTYPIPFEIGDSISFKIKINPAEGQHNLTGVPQFGGRTYEIKLVISDNDSNVAPGDETQGLNPGDGNPDVTNSYVH